MNKTELIKAFQSFYTEKTGENISAAAVNRNIDLIKEFVGTLVDNTTEVTVPGFFNLKYKIREAGLANVAGKQYDLPKKTTPVVKLASNFSKLN